MSSSHNVRKLTTSDSKPLANNLLHNQCFQTLSNAPLESLQTIPLKSPPQIIRNNYKHMTPTHPVTAFARIRVLVLAKNMLSKLMHKTQLTTHSSIFEGYDIQCATRQFAPLTFDFVMWNGCIQCIF